MSNILVSKAGGWGRGGGGTYHKAGRGGGRGGAGHERRGRGRRGRMGYKTGRVMRPGGGIGE